MDVSKHMESLNQEQLQIGRVTLEWDGERIHMHETLAWWHLIFLLIWTIGMIGFAGLFGYSAYRVLVGGVWWAFILLLLPIVFGGFMAYVGLTSLILPWRKDSAVICDSGYGFELRCVAWRTMKLSQPPKIRTDSWHSPNFTTVGVAIQRANGKWFCYCGGIEWSEADARRAAEWLTARIGTESDNAQS